MITAYLFLSLAIILEVAGTLLLGYSNGFKRKRWIIPVLALYAASYLMLFLSLEHHMPLGIAYGIWAAAGVVLTVLFAAIFFREKLKAPMLIGIVLIVFGILLIELG
jgi:small multidrug resistance pump